MSMNNSIIKEAKHYAQDLELPVIPICSPDHRYVTERHEKVCNNPGKTPLIKNWTTWNKTTESNIEKWQKRFKTFNIGIPLGEASGLIRVDIDGGEDGMKLLEQITGGEDLPSTWEFETPSGGLGMLYSIPKELLGKVKLEKYYIRNKDKEHVECALLGEGQQTVLPPSKHKNGGEYKWLEGHSPDEIDIKEAPECLIRHMIKKQEQASNIIYGETKKKAEEVLQNLSNKCAKFREILYEQKYGLLDEESWFRWVCVLVNIGEYKAAMYFSTLSSKHNKRSETRIEEKIKEVESKPIGPTRCINLGCGENEIFSCFGKFNINEENEIINSPAAFLINKGDNIKEKIEKAKKQLNEMLIKLTEDKYAFMEKESMANIILLYEEEKAEAMRIIEKISKISGMKQSEIKQEIKRFQQKQLEAQEKAIAKAKEKLTKIGFIFDKKGNFKKINGNIFAKHIKEHLDLLIFNEDTFYEYKDNVWKKISYLALSRKLRDLLHKYIDNIWSLELEEQYLEPLKREVDYVNEMNTHREYINLKNGLLNLHTFKLEKHRKDIYSSIQIPINYNPSADCPRFKAYLKDIFNGDNERIMLVQEILGYCLTAETKAQKGFIFLGEGSNGKSVLCDLMYHLYGKENISSVSMKDLSNSFARYNLVNKTVNISTENEIDSKGLDTQYLKAITTGDIIFAEEKYRQGISFRPFCKLIFALNKLPYSKDKSYGFIRRLIILLFDAKYELELSERDKKNPKIKKADPNLLDKLLEELDGILNFALEGLKRLRKNNYRFTQSKVSNKVLEDYKEEINVVLQFIRENIEEASNRERIVRGEIRKRFDEWCKDNRHKGAIDMNSRKFWAEFRKALDSERIFYSEGKSNGRDYFYGIRLLPKKKSELEGYLDEELEKPKKPIAEIEAPFKIAELFAEDEYCEEIEEKVEDNSQVNAS